MSEHRLSATMLREQLDKLRAEHGDDAFTKARDQLIVEFLPKANGEAFLKNVFPEVDLEPFKAKVEAEQAEGPAPTPETVLFDMLKKQLPTLKTQAHFNLFMGAFDSLRTTLDGYFSADPDKAKRARDALNKTLDMASRMDAMVEQVAEIPPEERSEKLREFFEPPKEFHEYDTQRQLLVDLAGISTADELHTWYEAKRAVMDKVVSQTLRNELFDSIRKKRVALRPKEEEN